MRTVVTLYRMFRDLAQDIQRITYTKDRVTTFQDRVEDFFVCLRGIQLANVPQKISMFGEITHRNQ